MLEVDRMLKVDRMREEGKMQKRVRENDGYRRGT